MLGRGHDVRRRRGERETVHRQLQGTNSTSDDAEYRTTHAEPLSLPAGIRDHQRHQENCVATAWHSWLSTNLPALDTRNFRAVPRAWPRQDNGSLLLFPPHVGCEQQDVRPGAEIPAGQREPRLRAEASLEVTIRGAEQGDRARLHVLVVENSGDRAAGRRR